MANPVCINQRLLLGILRAPSYRSTSFAPPCSCTPQQLIRTKTTLARQTLRNGPAISFGKDNDGVIAPYLKESNKRSKVKKEKAEFAPEEINESFEISGFIDRSRPTQHKRDTRTQNEVEEKDEDVAPSRATRESRRGDKKRKVDKDDSTATKSRSTQDVQGPRGKRKFGVGKEASETNRKPTLQKIAAERASDRRQGLSQQPDFEVQEKEQWMLQKNRLREKFQDGWNPRKKLSPDAMQGIKELHEQDPTRYSTALLAEQFKMSPEAIRRILKSKWLSTISPEKMQERRERWAKRHDRLWDQQSELGLRPRRTKDKTLEDPDQFSNDLERRRILGEFS